MLIILILLLLIIVVGILVIVCENLLLLVLIKILLIVSLFLLGLKVLVVGAIIGDFLTRWLSHRLLHLLLDSWALVVSHIRPSCYVGLGDRSISLSGISIRLEARLVSPNLHLSALFIGGPLSGVFITRWLNVGVRSSNNSTLSHWLLSNVVSVLNVGLVVHSLSLVLSGLVVVSFIPGCAVLLNNSIGPSWLITLIIGIVLRIVILGSIHLVSILILLRCGLDLLILVLGIIHLSVLVISHSGFSRGGVFSVDLLFIATIKIVGICLITDNFILITMSIGDDFNSVFLQKRQSLIGVFI
jgi:hypothetical protein